MKTLKLILGFLLVSSIAFADSGQLGGSGGGGGGNVIGPVVGTDNAIARFNGDGTHLKNSAVFVGDDRSLGGVSTVSMDSLISFDGIGGGAAITGSEYQIGRDADGTNQIHFNVPIGSSFEFSVNDSAQFTMSATQADFKDNEILSTKGMGIGDGRAGCIDGFCSDFQIARTVTDFSQVNTPSPGYWTSTSAYVTLDPSANLTTLNGGVLINVHDFETFIKSGNNKNFGNIVNFYYYTQALGSGSIGSLVNVQNGSIIGGTHSATENVAYQIQSGHFGTGGNITNDYTFEFDSPAHGNGGTMTNHWGIKMNDQEFGTNSWAIQTAGGKIEFGSPSGKDQILRMTDGDVTQPYTVFPTNTFFNLTGNSSTIGGAVATGLTDGDTIPLNLRGIMGTASPSNSTAYIRLFGAKTNGSGGLADVGNSETLFEIVNNSLGSSFPAIMCTGGRLCGMSTTNPNARWDISSNGSDSSTNSLRVTDSGSGNTIFNVRNDSHVTVGATGEGQNARFNVNGGNSAGASSESIDLNATLAAFNGSDNYTGLKINITNANHTGTGNTVYGIDIPGITFDADETAAAINVGSTGWNYAMKMSSGIGLNFGGIDVVDSGGALSIGAPVNVGGGESTFSGPISMSIGSGFGQFTASGSAGGCLMIRDTDGVNWTKCKSLAGVLTCVADGDGVCD